MQEAVQLATRALQRLDRGVQKRQESHSEDESQEEKDILSELAAIQVKRDEAQALLEQRTEEVAEVAASELVRSDSRASTNSDLSSSGIGLVIDTDA